MDKETFRQTVKDIKKLSDSTNKKQKYHFKSQNKKFKTSNQKMPIKMLNGIRNKIIKNYKKEQESNLQQSIKYNTGEKFQDKKFFDFINKKVKKNQHQKNSYKYQNMKNKKIGKYKNGVLNL